MADYTSIIINLSEDTLTRDASYYGSEVDVNVPQSLRLSSYSGYQIDAGVIVTVRTPHWYTFELTNPTQRVTTYGVEILSFQDILSSREINHPAIEIDASEVATKAPYGFSYDLVGDAVLTPNFKAYIPDPLVVRTANRKYDHVGVISGAVSGGQLAPRGHTIGGLTVQVTRTVTYPAVVDTLDIRGGQRIIEHLGSMIENVALNAVLPFQSRLVDPGLVVLSRNDQKVGTAFDGPQTTDRSNDYGLRPADAIIAKAAFSNTFHTAVSDLFEFTARPGVYQGAVIESGINTSEKPSTYSANVPSVGVDGKRWNDYGSKILSTGITSPARFADHKLRILSVEERTRRDGEYPAFVIKLDLSSRLETMVNGTVVDLIQTAVIRGNKSTSILMQDDILTPTFRGTGYEAYVFHPESTSTQRDRDYIARVLTNFVRPKRAIGTHKWHLLEVVERGPRNQRVMDVQVIGEYEKVELAKRLKQLRNLPQPSDARRMYYVL